MPTNSRENDKAAEPMFASAKSVRAFEFKIKIDETISCITYVIL
ncbi:hypothetical protein LEP1GSC172_0171 [Leptospira noguchii]|uniref:Uncharacterized protein n=1 Tax=Leptospira noguchii TaxID=28182 RepID=M6V4U3_9LEPT|nr:hypothetical protein LEP1GSC172_0171 [Leptospira noguchii]